MKKGIGSLILCCICLIAASCSNTPDRSKLTQHIEFEVLNPDSLVGDLLKQKQTTTITKIEGRLDKYNVAHIVEQDSIAGDGMYRLLLPAEAKLSEIEQIILQKGELGIWAVHATQDIITPEMIDSLVTFIDFQGYSGGSSLASVLSERKNEVMEHIIEMEKRNMFPQGTKLMFGKPEKQVDREFCSLYALKGVGVIKRATMSGEHIISAKAEQSTYGSAWEVSVNMNATGANQFKNVTSENIGRPLAIVFDNEVYSAPIVNSAIEGGSFVISGNFTKDEAKKMAIMLELGALPLPVVIKNVVPLKAK